MPGYYREIKEGVWDIVQIKICYLYPDLFNLHGDRGNLLVLYRRAEWRGIKVQVDDVSLGDKPLFSDYDLVFLGGGTEQYLDLVIKDLQVKSPYLIEAVERGMALLSIGLGFQMLGNYYVTRDNTLFPGAGVFDLHTEVKGERLKGNILLELIAELQDELGTVGVSSMNTIVGYENHSGHTYLGDIKPLGKVLKGWGNNPEDKTEGAVYNNAFGTSLHGPLLANNPHLADLLLTKSLSGKNEIELTPLDDQLEIYVHNMLKKRLLR